MNSWLVLLLGVACLLGLADLIVHVAYSFAALHRFETLPTLRVLPAPSNAPQPEEIRFPTTNGLHLRGGVYFPEDGHPRGVIVYCPETGGGFDTAMNYTAALVHAGFAVVSFSFRNQAPSDVLQGYHSNYWVSRYEVEDVHAALDFVEAQPQLRGLPVGLVGVSRGAGAALAAGAIRPEIMHIWTQGGFSSNGLAVYHAMKFLQTMVGPLSRLIPKWHVRVTIWFMLKLNEYRNRCRLIHLESFLPFWQGREAMFVSGARDTYVPTSLSTQLCQQAGHLTATSQWVVPQAKHNMERAIAQAQFDERIVQFFEDMVPRRGAVPSEKSAVAR